MNKGITRRKLFVMSAAAGAPFLAAKAVTPGRYYTTANIWYEKPDGIQSTNYHVGVIIPAGTEVEVLSVARSKITFRDNRSGVSHVLTYVKKHSSISFGDFFERYFSPSNNVPERMKKFSDKEKDNIKAGTIAVGMSRDAVLMAYGYPPSHKTPNLDGNLWIYWDSRFRTKQVVFADGKVATIS